MPRGTRKEEENPLWRLLEMIDDQVELRQEHAVAERAATAEIVRLSAEARDKGATMPQLLEHVKRVDKEGNLVAMSRQNLDTMLAGHTQRREPKTTRASRRRRGDDESTAGGRLNVDALA
jgi:hypothetical protein